jgi:hypothetical protein
MTNQQRFMKGVVKEAATGCWFWMNAAGNRYPTFSLNGRSINIYRASYALFKGEINTGDRVTHTCGDKLCVNPAHLELKAAIKQDNTITTPVSYIDKSLLDYIDYLYTTTHIDKGIISAKLSDILQSHHADADIIKFLQM